MFPEGFPDFFSGSGELRWFRDGGRAVGPDRVGDPGRAHIVNDTSIPMRNSDIAEKVQRSLPPGESVSAEVVERMIEHYWSVDLDNVEPPAD